MNAFRWPIQASHFALDVDRLFIFLCIVSGAALLLIAGFIAYFCFRYQRRKHPRSELTASTNVPLELTWSLVTLLFFLVAFVWGARLYLQSYQIAPDDSYTVYAVGKQWMWKFQHSNGQREINELHVPLHRPVRIHMISEDVIHSLYIPEFRIKHDVLPMAYSELWFEANQAGNFRIFCAEYCGLSHSGMSGVVRVLEPEAFQAWQQQTGRTGGSSERGAQLYSAFGCNSCHKSGDERLAPSLVGIYGQTVELADGSRVAVDASYIRESILQPDAKRVKNFQAIMPSYAGRISEDDILSLMTYIQSLKGPTP